MMLDEEIDDDDEEIALECQLCGGPLIYLGILGQLIHSRCRNCGMQFSHPVEDGEIEEEEEDE